MLFDRVQWVERMALQENRVIIFTDGACTGNPGPGGWATIIALPDGSVKELAGREPNTTNNRMEMMAAISALAAVPVPAPSPILLYTDSTYVIQGITKWIWGWKSRGWKNSEGKDVANRDLWEQLAAQLARLKPATVEWLYVRGHAGIEGNERCDELAVAFSLGKTEPLFRGPKDQYFIDLDNLPVPDAPPEKKSSSRGTSGGGSKSAAGTVSYLSYHNGVVMRHKTWTECERRVKGQSNARFKKANSANEEREILSGWGLDPNSTVIET
jgi:ribonuclease HI